MKHPEQLYAVIAEGEDSFCVMQMKGVALPMVFAQGITLAKAQQFIQEIAREKNRTLHVVKYTKPEVINTVTPNGDLI